MTSRVSAPGAGWRPAGQFKKAGLNSEVVENLNAMADSAARANVMDFGKEGIHTSQGFYSTGGSQAQSSVMKIVLLQDALLPGTYDLPGQAKGAIMELGSNNRLAQTSEVVDVVNYSTSIYGPIGGLVLAQEWSGVLVAVGSSG